MEDFNLDQWAEEKAKASFDNWGSAKVALMEGFWKALDLVLPFSEENSKQCEWDIDAFREFIERLKT